MGDVTAGVPVTTDHATDLDGLLAAGLQAYTAEEYDRARQLFTRLLHTARPGEPAGLGVGQVLDIARRYLGRTLLDLGQFDAAVEHLAAGAAELTVRYGPADEDAALGTVALGDALRRQGSTRTLAAAGDCYRRVTGLPATRIGHAPAGLRRAVRFARAGLALLDAEHGRYDDALTGLDRVIRDLAGWDGFGDHDLLRLVEETTDLQLRLGAVTRAYALLDVALPAAAVTLGSRHPLTRRLHLRRTPSVSRPAPARRLRSATPTHRSRDGSGVGGRRLTGAASLLAVVTVAAATGVLIYLTARPDTPAGTPNGSTVSTTPTARATQPAAATSAAVSLPPPADVRVTATTSTSITVRWADPSGGTRPTAVSLSRPGGPALPPVVVQAAATRYRTAGLTPDTRYCLVVATIYTPTVLAAAAPTCSTTEPAAARFAPGEPR
ncbi:fibronectin type III domain-containing protein [Dactylosporangium sp. NBC_01737]|uniref:fibronectin type III domain-containing protein n=1 Tax=Dactylosporangium sp. NBC_01737 TaxID=2975959 RepID=UPI002E10BB90|nr:fibronectin type III domain-containing protein [Dactylosporangium sp. NBC_01737]